MPFGIYEMKNKSHSIFGFILNLPFSICFQLKTTSGINKTQNVWIPFASRQQKHVWHIAYIKDIIMQG